MIDDLAFWTMLNSLGIIAMTVAVFICGAWIYSELQHIINKMDNLK